MVSAVREPVQSLSSPSGSSLLLQVTPRYVAMVFYVIEDFAALCSSLQLDRTQSRWELGRIGAECEVCTVLS